MWISASNPRFAASGTPTSSTPIELDVVWEDTVSEDFPDGVSERFTADQTDVFNPYSVDLQSRAYAGEFGAVAAYSPGANLTPPPGWEHVLENLADDETIFFNGQALAGRWWQAAAAVPDVYDFNYDFASGWHSIGATMDNGYAGTATYTGVLLVIQRNASTVRQTQIFFSSAGAWWRYGTGTYPSITWGAWKQVFSSSLDVENLRSLAGYSNNNLGVGDTASAGVKLRLSGAIDAPGTTNRGTYSTPLIPTESTTFTNFDSYPVLQTGVSTVVRHFQAYNAQAGGTGAVTTQYGFYVHAAMVGGTTTNAGFYGGLAEDGTLNYNIYCGGTAPNYMAGQLRGYGGIFVPYGDYIHAGLEVGQSSGNTQGVSIGGSVPMIGCAVGSGAQFGATRFANDTAGAAIRLGKSRATGPTVAAVAVQSGDALGALAFYGDDGADIATIAASITAYVDGAVSADTVPGRLVFHTSNSGGTSTERMRLDSSGNLQMGGANTVIDANRIHVHRSYTIATLPSAVTGGTIYVSDLGGGGGLMWSDGTNWRRLTEAGVATVNTDANFTLTPLTSAPDQTHTGTLTANRTITLSTTNAYNGARFCVTRTGGGAFTLSVGGLKSLSQNQWAEVVYNGSAWVLSAYGTL